MFLKKDFMTVNVVSTMRQIRISLISYNNPKELVNHRSEMLCKQKELFLMVARILVKN